MSTEFSILGRMRSAIRSIFLTPAPEGPASNTWQSDRLNRYTRYWNLYSNTAYTDIASYLDAFGEDQRLYKWTRGLRSPVYRYVEFYASNTWGGILDPKAGETGALPIITDYESIRPAIAKLWQWSNWSSKRVLAVRYGAALGDCFIKVRDNPAAKKVYLQTIYPSQVTDILWDDFGNIKMIKIERTDYESINGVINQYKYTEVHEHPSVWGGTNTRISTYRNDALFAFGSNSAAQWELPYDFVPVVHIPHIDVGMGFGATGFRSVERKIADADAVSSQLSDQIGKSLNTPIVLLGALPGDYTIENKPGQVPVVYISDPNVKIEKLIYDMNLQQALMVLNAQMDDIKNDLPELSLREAVRSGMSSDALGQVYGDVIANIQNRRADYDAGLVRAQMMALAIGGIRRYGKEFSRFSLDSYANGRLDHSIGKRPILPHSNMESLQEEIAQWNATVLAESVMGTEAALREVMGYDDKQVELALKSKEQDLEMAAKSSGNVTGNNKSNMIAGITKKSPTDSQQAKVSNGPTNNNSVDMTNQ